MKDTGMVVSVKVPLKVSQNDLCLYRTQEWWLCVLQTLQWLQGDTGAVECLKYPSQRAHLHSVCVDLPILGEHTPSPWLCRLEQNPRLLLHINNDLMPNSLFSDKGSWWASGAQHWLSFSEPFNPGALILFFLLAYHSFCSQVAASQSFIHPSIQPCYE